MEPVDQIRDVLAGDSQLTDPQRAALWDLADQSPTHHELAVSLQPLSMADETKGALVAAKKSQSKGPVQDAIRRMQALGPEKLLLIEKHPHVFAAMLHGGQK